MASAGHSPCLQLSLIWGFCSLLLSHGRSRVLEEEDVPQMCPGCQKQKGWDVRAGPSQNCVNSQDKLFQPPGSRVSKCHPWV